MKNQRAALPAALLLIGLASTESLASPADYQFSIVADSTGPLSSFGTPTLNRNGTAAFVATRDSGGAGVYASSGVVRAVAEFASNGPFEQLGTPRINDAGTVAYIAPDNSYVATGTAGGPQTTLADASGPFSHFASVDINASGRVVFSAGRDAGGGGFFSSDAGTIAPLVTTDDGYTSLGGLKLNDAGTVIGHGRRTTLADTVFTISNGARTTVASSNSAQYTGFGDSPTINTSGEIAFYANGHNPSGLAIFKISNGTTTVVAREGDVFLALNEAMIDDVGGVIFFAVPPSGGPPRGIYAGPNPSTDRVIGVGDLLNGSRVTSIEINDGVSPNGDVAFSYYLADGRSGIAIASRIVPEPTTLAAIASTSFLFARRRRR